MSGLTRLVSEKLQVWRETVSREKRRICTAIQKGRRRAYVMGCNANGLEIASRIQATGFVVDAAYYPGPRWRGLPVITFDKLDRDSVVFNAVLLRRPHTAYRRLRKLPNPVLTYADWERCTNAEPLTQCQKNRDFWWAHRNEFEFLYHCLDDGISCQTLQDLLFYWLTLDPVWTEGYSLRDKDQYFDFLEELPDEFSFVDGGAYQGETSAELLSRKTRVLRIWLFEPSAHALAVAKRRLGNDQRFCFVQAALSDTCGVVGFDPTLGPASKILSDGPKKVQAVRLDDVVEQERVDFIKLDLEGSEVAALYGAGETIRRNRPMLAICIYHRFLDWLKVPRAIDFMALNYRLAVRHYTEGLEETVLYFLPKL